MKRFFVDEIGPGQLFKPWHGVAERYFNRGTTLTMLVPFNWVWRIYRSIEALIRYPEESAFERNRDWRRQNGMLP